MDCLCPTQVEYQLIPQKAQWIFKNICEKALMNKYVNCKNLNYEQLKTIAETKDSFDYKLNYDIPTIIELNDYVYAILYFNQKFNFIPKMSPSCFERKKILGYYYNRKNGHYFSLADFVKLLELKLNIDYKNLLSHVTDLNFETTNFDNITSDQTYLFANLANICNYYKFIIKLHETKQLYKILIDDIAMYAKIQNLNEYYKCLPSEMLKYFGSHICVSNSKNVSMKPITYINCIFAYLKTVNLQDINDNFINKCNFEKVCHDLRDSHVDIIKNVSLTEVYKFLTLCNKTGNLITNFKIDEHHITKKKYRHIDNFNNCGIYKLNISFDLEIGLRKTSHQKYYVMCDSDKVYFEFTLTDVLVGQPKNNFVIKVNGYYHYFDDHYYTYYIQDGHINENRIKFEKFFKKHKITIVE